MWWIKSAGVLFLLLGIYSCFATLHALWKKPRLAGGVVTPGIVIELARTSADVEGVLRQVTAEELLKGVRIDSRMIIPIYWAVLMVFSAPL
jgi:hypothetical protein